MNEYANAIKKIHKISFIPTMGALHKGHMSLLAKAYKENPCTKIIVSLFVNPTQFTEKKDFEKYPHTIDADIKKLVEFEKQEGLKIDAVFIPKGATFYSDTEYPSLRAYTIEKQDIVLPKIFFEAEGKSRPGHFEGVFQVLFRLFHIIRPDFAIFGQKDFQQVLLVQYLQKQYFQFLQIITGDIFREPSGLAMSSRNMRLSKNEKERASVIYKALRNAKLFIEKEYETKNYISVETILSLVKNILLSESFIEKIHSIEIRKRMDFYECDRIEKNKKYVLLVSVQYAGIHLIDNILL